jgi:hypothetical protein
VRDQKVAPKIIDNNMDEGLLDGVYAMTTFKF